jgi:hypothetical protein
VTSRRGGKRDRDGRTGGEQDQRLADVSSIPGVIERRLDGELASALERAPNAIY